MVAVSDRCARSLEHPPVGAFNTYVTLGTDGFGFPTPGPPPAATSTPTLSRRWCGRVEALARDGEIDPSIAIALPPREVIDDVLAAPTDLGFRGRPGVECATRQASHSHFACRTARRPFCAYRQNLT